MKKLTPKQRLKVYRYAFKTVRFSVCVAIKSATAKLYYDTVDFYRYNTVLLFKEQFPEFENERIRRHESYGNHWWNTYNNDGLDNTEIRKEFIKEKLIDKVSEIINA